jgi:hypothetical protein
MNLLSAGCLIPIKTVCEEKPTLSPPRPETPIALQKGDYRAFDTL